MLNKYTVQLMALGIAGSFAATAVAEDSALIDALVKKGVLKTKEAEQIRAEAAKSNHSSAGKLDISTSVKSLTLSGDVRARYSYGSMTLRSAVAEDTAQLSFYELRLRINADYKLSDDFFAGFGLRTLGAQSGLATFMDASNQSFREDNAMMGNGFNDYLIGVHRAFIGWNPVDGVSLTAGKQGNPFYTTDLVWDSDIFPAGFSQKVDLNKTLGVSGVDLSLVAGQFVFADNREYRKDDHANRDAFIWQTQLVAGIEVGSSKLTVAPGYLATNGASLSGDDVTSDNYRAMNDVQVLLLPGDLTGELAGVKATFLWDFAYNFAGRDHAIHNSGLQDPRASEKLSWLVGVKLGENNKKGDWSAYVNYRRAGEGLPGGLGDNYFGFGDSRNMSGFKFGGAYSIGDASTFGVNYYRFGDNRSQNPSGFDSGDLLQAEIGVKF